MVDEKHMLVLFISYLLFPIHPINSTPIPFIQNATLHTSYFDSRSPLINGTCHQCLCMSSLSYSAVNCYPNNTCQLFSTFPVSYRIESTPGGRLYFPKQSFPSTSQCCMPNITYLLNKLRAASVITKSVANPRDAIIDDHDYFVTVEIYGNTLVRFDPNNLTQINNILLPNNEQISAAYFNGAYYIAPYYSPMTVINSENLTLLTRISTQTNGPRAIMFLNNGQTMVLTDCDNDRIVFLNRTSIVPIQYNVSFSRQTTFSGPHGLWYVNDSFFYVTSYTENSLYSLRNAGLYNQWNSTLVIPAVYSVGSGGAARMVIDECGRFWITLEIDTIVIYDQQGNYIANWTIPNSNIFDIKIMDNYLIYLTDTISNQTMRVDPGFQCYF